MLFVNRLVFVFGEVEDGGVSLMFWYFIFFLDDIDFEVDLVRFFFCFYCEVIF